jgi:UDP-GlcNAc:undecaprenyl-phosphate GlcNAc-1-phosphate transferase
MTSILIGFLVFPILIKFLQKIKFGDIPGGRKIHKEFTPSMGGIGIFISFFFSLVVWGGGGGNINKVWFLVAGLIIIFFIGMSDDIVDLRAHYKLIGQIIAASIVVIQGDMRITSFYGFIGVNVLPEYFSYTFSIFVLLVTSNAFNLIDGVDGLAGSVSAIALSFLGIWFSVHGFESFALLSFSLLGAVLAFLIYNWQPAKIFMGDTGALTLGFTIGVLVICFFKSNEMLLNSVNGKFNSPFTIGLALMIYPLFDTMRVFVKRILRGTHPMKADKSHIHHFLLRSGMSHQKVTIIISSVQLILLIITIFISSLDDNWSMIILIGLIIIFGVLVVKYTIYQIRKKVFYLSRFVNKKLPDSIPQKKNSG